MWKQQEENYGKNKEIKESNESPEGNHGGSRSGLEELVCIGRDNLSLTVISKKCGRKRVLLK